MNDQLLEHADELMAWVGQTAMSAEHFVLEQAPLLAREIVLFERISTGTSLGISVLVLIVALALILSRSLKIKRLQVLDKTTGDVEDFDWILPIIGLVLGGVLTLAGIIGIIENHGDFIKAMTAPRLVILEKMGELID